MPSPVLSLFFGKPKDLLQALFLRAIQKEGTKCIEWQGSIGTNGRPETSIMGTVLSVQCLVYFANNGKSIEDLEEFVLEDAQIYNTCRNSMCINPEHLQRRS